MPTARAHEHLGFEIKRYQQRQIFLAAREEARSGKLSNVNRLLASIGDYPLKSYIIFEALLARPRSKDDDVLRFLDDHPRHPISHRLQKRFTDYRRQQNRPESFLKFYQPSNRDAENGCFHAWSLWQSGDPPAAMRATEQLWLTGTSQPKQCDRPFALWRKQGGLTPILAWQRFELALLTGESRLARYLERYLSDSQRELAKWFTQVIKKPTRLTQFSQLDLNNPLHQKLGGRALSKLSSQKPDIAGPLIQQMTVEGRLALSDAKQYWVASVLSQLRQADLPLSDLDLPTDIYNQPAVIEAQLKQFIRLGQFSALLNWLDRLGPESQKLLQWQYWKARALLAQGSPSSQSTAIDLLRALATQRDYYGYLSAQWLNQPGNLQDRSTSISPSQLLDLAAAPAVQRTYELRAVGDVTAARREWLSLLTGFSNTELRIASALASRWRWYDMAIQAHAKAESWDEVEERFPEAYPELFQEAALTYGVPPYLAIGVARRESAFWADAISPVGALGVMQVMPTTANLVAKRLEIDPIEPEDLSRPDKNIQIGTAYLGNLLQQFNGNRVLALAAYNAGPTRAKRWRKNRLPIDAWIESIPFAETRAYVKNVLLYAAIYSQKSGLAEPLIYPYEVSQFAQPETLFSFSPPSADATAGNL